MGQWNCTRTEYFPANFHWDAELTASSYKVAGSKPIQVSMHMLMQLEKSTVKWKASSKLNHFGITLSASNVHGK